jgi:hypothetical protein
LSRRIRSRAAATGVIDLDNGETFEILGQVLGELGLEARVDVQLLLEDERVLRASPSFGRGEARAAPGRPG